MARRHNVTLSIDGDILKKIDEVRDEYFPRLSRSRVVEILLDEVLKKYRHDVKISVVK
jgi:metal-responsive CopG/Arc/MetJ family transcriptional regulator